MRLKALALLWPLPVARASPQQLGLPPLLPYRSRLSSAALWLLMSPTAADRASREVPMVAVTRSSEAMATVAVATMVAVVSTVVAASMADVGTADVGMAVVAFIEAAASTEGEASVAVVTEVAAFTAAVVVGADA